MSISQRYLEAKRTVDDRALNCRILSRLSEELEAQGAPSIVDIGAGIGIGLERYLELGLPSPCDYTAVDESASFLEIAERRLRDRVQGRFIASTLEDFSSDPSEHGRFDFVLAHAFLDIIDLGPSLQALIGLARAMAMELAGDHIQVNALCPGWVDTEMAWDGLRGLGAALGVSEREAHDIAMQDVPLGKMSKPEEIAGMVAWLVSEDAAGVTGQGLNMNNGAFML